MIERPDWDTYFLAGVQWVATRADCRRRQHGCILVDKNHRVIATGYNGAAAGKPGCLSGACPRGLLTYDQLATFSSYDEGPGRCISIHAEQNALLWARESVRGGTAYVTGQPCPTCAKLLEAAGIVRVVY